MPAIQLERLRRQAADLAALYQNPSEFIRKLTDLFEFYADRTHRSGQDSEKPVIIKVYKVPEPVMRRILSALQEPLHSDPSGTLPLIDALWERPALEFRDLAVSMLGSLTASMSETVIERVRTWNRDNDEDVLLESIANQGLKQIRSEAKESFLQLVEQWLMSAQFKEQRLGLRALLVMAHEASFESLPVIYRLLGTTVENATQALRPDLLDVIRPLAKRSPQETAYFLRQSLAKAKDPKIAAWLIRHSVKEFPPEMQNNLRAALRQ
jgi:hypothetical protein